MDTYIINLVEASAMFDEEGRILNVYVDQLEVSSPNNGRDYMPHFQSWPGIESYTAWNHETKALEKANNTNDFISKEIAEWKTKRERGDQYQMDPKKNWYHQMDHFQKMFVGKL